MRQLSTVDTVSVCVGVVSRTYVKNHKLFYPGLPILSFLDPSIPTSLPPLSLSTSSLSLHLLPLHLLCHCLSLQINYEADCSQRHALPSDSESLDCLDGPSPEPGADRRRSSVSLSCSVNSEDILCNRSPEHHSTVPRPFSDPSIPDSLKMEDEGTYVCMYVVLQIGEFASQCNYIRT